MYIYFDFDLLWFFKNSVDYSIRFISGELSLENRILSVSDVHNDPNLQSLFLPYEKVVLVAMF